MKIANSIIIAAWVIAILGAGFYLYYERFSEPTQIETNQTTNVSCENMSSIEERDACFYDKAFTMSDASFCARVKTNVTQWNCYQSLALNQRNQSTCAQIKGGRNEIVDVRDECYRQVAVLVNDFTICNPVSPTHKDSCYLDVGQINNNKQACAQIIEANLRGVCYNTLKE